MSTNARQSRRVWLLLVVGAMAVELAAQTSPSVVRKLVDAAVERTAHHVRYDGKYVRIPYPNGDVPANTGVCTDEIIRIYHTVGIDLQREVHDDILANPSAYPRKAGRPADTNIDHRRVPNLMVFFGRMGQSLPKSLNPADYSPGDVVTWDLGGGVDHIGMVVDKRGPSRSYMVVHNIGAGPQMEDVLFNWKVTGHYRYYGSTVPARSASR